MNATERKRARQTANQADRRRQLAHDVSVWSEELRYRRVIPDALRSDFQRSLANAHQRIADAEERLMRYGLTKEEVEAIR